ncbi:phage tail tape measure C-terminal domain-containing protein [Desulfocurvibacter africanus]|uniref:phage tail tape measure C-terminal domain-containing protein n=1 Tax=Desulfocurvibacter africanus TaxID=873 RepID=UPI0004002CF4|nr:phage tail tape measure C-terminal domain-containing protein [Desulfocurvibacter africanus]
MAIATNEYKFTEKDLRTLTQASAELRTATKEMQQVSAAALGTAEAHKKTVAAGGTALSSLRLGNPAGSVSDLSGPVTAADMEAQSQQASMNRSWLSEKSGQAWDWATEKTKERVQVGIKEMEEWGEKAMDVSDEIKALGKNTMEEFGQVIQTVAAGGKANFKSMTDSIIDDLKRIAIQMATGWLAKTVGSYLGSALSGWLGSGSGGTTGGTTYGGYPIAEPVYAAHGLAFDQSGVMAFAKGGIVSRPTVFPFARGVGLMGEAGPEAIMPLSRTASGDLGVRVADNSAPQSVRVEIHNESGEKLEVSKSEASNDIQGLVVSLWLDAFERNRGGLRTSLGG